MARSMQESILEHNRKATRSAADCPTTPGRGWKSCCATTSDPPGYLSRALPFREGEIDGDYDHLARVLEWSAGGDGRAGANAANEAPLRFPRDGARGRQRRPIPAIRSGCRPMPVRARRMCCRSASSACCSGHRPVEDPVSDLYARRRGQHGEPRVRRPCRLDHARRRRAGRARSRGSKAGGPAREKLRAGAATVHRGAGDAGRPEDPDHPRLLRSGPAPVSARGQHRRRISRCSTRRWSSRCSPKRAGT